MKSLVLGAMAAAIAAGSAFAQDNVTVRRQQMVGLPLNQQQVALIEPRLAAVGHQNHYVWYGQYVKGEWRPGWVAVR